MSYSYLWGVGPIFAARVIALGLMYYASCSIHMTNPIDLGGPAMHRYRYHVEDVKRLRHVSDMNVTESRFS